MLDIWLSFLVLGVAFLMLVIDGLLFVCTTLIEDMSVVTLRSFLIRFCGCACGSGLLSSSNFSASSRGMYSAWSIDLYCGVPSTVPAGEGITFNRFGHMTNNSQSDGLKSQL